MPEAATFYAFALRDAEGAFASFAGLEGYAEQRKIPVVPVLFRGRFQSVAELREFMGETQRQPSALGGEREGVVLRLAKGFAAAEFHHNVCKSLRIGHVQTNEHWTRNWRPCKIESPADANASGPTMTR